MLSFQDLIYPIMYMIIQWYLCGKDKSFLVEETMLLVGVNMGKLYFFELEYNWAW